VRLKYHMTHQQIADELGISRQMVRVIEYKALRKLSRSPILQAYAKHIDDYMEEYHGEKHPSVR
jgi:DNA-directed RNA polymerase sigma subunit (sigma70/sigma32)